MTIWDGGGPGQQPEDEREAEWVESDGDLPFLPDANEWVEPVEGDDPLFDLLKRDADTEDDTDGA